MKAAVLTAPGQIRIDDVPLPEPGPGEIRIRLEGSGVCASNLAHWQGMPWSQYPMEPGALGHEGWGTVDAVGKGVTGVRAGDRVAALSCKSYAEYDISKSDCIVPIPKSLGKYPFPGEALGCGFNIFDRSLIRAGQTVVIIGIGFLGATLTRLAKNAGARVIAVSRRAFSLQVAKTMGADELIPMNEHFKIIEQIKELTSGKLADVVIEAVGKQSPLELAAEVTREHGRLVIAGYHQDGPRQVNMQLWNWRGLDVVNAHERNPERHLSGIRSALRCITEGKFDPSPLLTHRYCLADLGRALDDTRDRPEGFLKALIVYE